MTIQKILHYFLRGLLLLIPSGLTVYVIYVMVTWTDQIMPWKIPGLGLITVFVITTVIGALANTIIARPIFNWLNRIISKIPVIGVIYTSINDLTTAFSGEKKKFDQPVLVPFDDKDILYKPGFITQSDLAQIGLPGKVTVYLPHSYNFSGNVFIVDSSKLIHLEGRSTNIMKYIVSGGLSGDFQVK